MAYTIHTGNVLDILPTLPANSVQCCITSPPYWGLRDYGVAGQLGSEATPEEFVANMVAVFREVRRVLRDDGTLWLNLGDSYAGSGGAGGDYNEGGLKQGQPRYSGTARAWKNGGGRDVGERTAAVPGLKPKDLVGIPWRVALALQADGWWLRSDIIWHKPNPMPESVTDRPTKAHEYIFLLTKSARYYYDAEAIKEPAQIWTGLAGEFARGDGKSAMSDSCPPGQRPQKRADRKPTGIKFGGDKHPGNNGNHTYSGNEYMAEPTRNRRDVWSITTKPYSEAHFATFPPELPELCILAGTSAKGACPECGAPWERCVEKETRATSYEYVPIGIPGENNGKGRRPGSMGAGMGVLSHGWQPTCACDCKDGERENTVPCVALDPFTGSGTTGAVAVTLGRDFVGCELNPAYVELAHRRIGNAQPALFGI